ncbi:MAG: hypothetical protein OHK0047_08820 [Leptolyngbyaceae cyanobacterium]
MSNHSTSYQAKLNLEAERFTLAKEQTTFQVRSLIKQLTGQHVTAQKVLHEGRSGSLKVPSEYGWLIVTTDSNAKKSRLWRWNVDFAPVNFYRTF